MNNMLEVFYNQEFTTWMIVEYTLEMDQIGEAEYHHYKLDAIHESKQRMIKNNNIEYIDIYTREGELKRTVKKGDLK